MTLVNQTISHYKIVSQVGAGGMGEVYLAEDTQLGRRVAIKFLSPELVADERANKRLVKEARAAATLDHPNICSIYEVGEADGRSFIAMQYIEGETLDARIKSKPLELKESLTIAAQIADALAEAHSHGIIHRDIKPGNIMITSRGQAKVMDFGLARVIAGAVESEAETQSLLTTPGTIMGTMPYMSPEQVRGEVLDGRSDIFSFGVVLYEMLSGRQPFASESAAATISAILMSEPPPLARFTRVAPAELERIVVKALTKDREERYQTAKDLLIDLGRLKQRLEVEAEIERSAPPEMASDAAVPSSAGPAPRAADTARASVAGAVATEAQPVSSAEYIFSEIKRHKRGVAVALAAIILLSVAGTAYYFGRGGKTAIDSIAVLPFANTSNDQNVEYLSDGISEALINSLTELRQLRVVARSTAFRYKGKEVDPQAVGRELNVRAVLMGRVRQMGDMLNIQVDLVDATTGAQLWGQEYERKSSDVLSIKQAVAREVTEKLRLRLSGDEQRQLTKRDTTNPEAYRAYWKGMYYWNKGLAPGYEKSREYFQQAIDLDPTYALAYSGLAHYYSFASTVGLLPPNENWPKAEAAANKALALDDTLAETYNALAAIKLYYYRDWPAAERYFRRGIELNPNSAEIRAHYSGCLAMFGRGEESLAEIQRAIDIDPLSPRFNYFWGRTLFSGRQYDRAIDQFRKALELDPNSVPAYESLGDAYEKKGMQREAITEWGKALTLSGAGEQASILERTYAASGFEAAVRALAKQRLERLNERMERGEYVSASEYVPAYTRMGDKEQALAWLDKAVQERTGFVFGVKVDPIYDKLRDDPRFQDSMRRTGFPQ